MATASPSPLLGYVRRLAAAQLPELSDAQLLERFVRRRDEAAFTVLVRRHGPLVLGVCRRVLRDGHLAQDCFQITFLLLARKAASLSRPEALASWLYGVAARTARKARGQAARRRCQEARAAAHEAIRDPDDRDWHDLRPLLDESVSALPDKYRVPFVLHHLQGLTVTEVAQRLKCPRGSIATRLSRARERLRARLVRRGVVLSAGGLLLALSESAVPAALPAALAMSTAQTAARVAAGAEAIPSLFPARTTVFAEGVKKIMHTTKAKVLAGLALAAMFAAGAGMFAHRTQAADTERITVPASIAATARREPPPRRPRVRFLSLAEARAIALENGTIGQPSLLFPGVGLDNLQAEKIQVRAIHKPGAEGIVIAGIPADRDRVELERNLNQVLLNVENAYWNLYGSYWQLHSREQALRLALETRKIAVAQYKAGRVGHADCEQAEMQCDLFRRQRQDAIDNILDNERQLKAMLGLPADDGRRLVPSDAPTLMEKQPDWEKALAETMKNRPELRLARRDLEQAKKKAAKDKAAKLELARAQLVLQDQELKAERYLGLYYRRMSSAYFQIKAARAQRREFATQLRNRFADYRADDPESKLDLLLEAQRFWADALATEYQAITTYNSALCGWEYARATICDYAHITLADKPPADDGEEIRAVEYEQKQTRQSVSRAKAVPVDPLLPPERKEAHPRSAVSLPSLWKARPPLPEDEG